MSLLALVGADVFDGKRLLKDNAVLIDGGKLRIIPAAGLPQYCAREALSGGILMPGFVDLQVNGGGGAMLNDAPSRATIETIARAHHGLGTRAFLPTLITDRPEKVTAAIAAVVESVAEGVPGVLGLHLEGPHLDPRRTGAHDPALIRPITEDNQRELTAAAKILPNLLLTVAPEAVSTKQIKALSEAGVIVSLGHSDCDYETAMRAFEAGARCVTHLFNAMSQLGSRAPGLVGAALDMGAAAAGLIADGIHVHPATIRAALGAKKGPGEVFLVSDATACAGSEITEFTLNGRTIRRAQGRLQLADATLAGADLSLGRAVQVMIDDVGDVPERALARATSTPAGVLRDAQGYGSWPDTLDGLIYLDDGFTAHSVASLL